MNPSPSASIADVREHYDQLSIFYRWLWGEHIHHGFWENEESPAQAQDKLIRRLVRKAGLSRGARVLDVGCGLGGSSLWLARELGCSVLGITISPAQRRAAERRARRAGLGEQVRFEVHDANALDLGSEAFDAVWVIECSEHLADKADFFRRCGGALRPGGTLALCAWLAAESRSADANPALVEEVCRGMLCPSLGSMGEHLGWLEAAGLEVGAAEDITRQVERTWELCERIVRRPWVRALLPFMGKETRQFAASFYAIRRAYAEDAMAYGLITARKPGGTDRRVNSITRQ